MPPLGFELREYDSLSDVGVRRSHNQDSFAVTVSSEQEAWREKGHLFLVADGMGAHAVGELASKLAADLIPHTYHKYAAQGAAPAIRRAFEEANATIHQRGQQNPEFEGMGTTTSALLIRPEGVWTAHVGDSRVYRIRAGHIEQLSFDHSLQWELAKRQGVDPDEISGVPSNVIVRSLGPEATVQVDIEGPHHMEPGDTFLICSDGLSNPLTDAEIGATVMALPLREACQLLVDMANLRGGPDNITVVAVRLPGESPPSSSEFRLIPPRRKPSAAWFARLPWAGIALGAGITLALTALLLVILALHKVAIGTFLLAAFVLILGLYGLHRTYQAEQQPRPEEEHGPPRVYRRLPCQPDQRILQRLIEAESTVQDFSRSNGLAVDWGSHQRYLKLAGENFSKGDIISAYREHWRALGELTRAIRQHRKKEERFQPLW